MAQKNRLENVPKVHFLLSLILLRFPPKKAKCVVSARKSRQQIGLKAIWHVYLYIYVHIYTYIYIYISLQPFLVGTLGSKISQKSPSFTANTAPNRHPPLFMSWHFVFCLFVFFPLIHVSLYLLTSWSPKWPTKRGYRLCIYIYIYIFFFLCLLLYVFFWWGGGWFLPNVLLETRFIAWQHLCYYRISSVSDLDYTPCTRLLWLAFFAAIQPLFSSSLVHWSSWTINDTLSQRAPIPTLIATARACLVFWGPPKELHNKDKMHIFICVFAL